MDVSDSGRLPNVKTEQYVSVQMSGGKTYLAIALGYLVTQKGTRLASFARPI
jgi:hypothetical protein